MFCLGCSSWYGYYLERHLGLNIAAISLFGRCIDSIDYVTGIGNGSRDPFPIPVT